MNQQQRRAAQAKNQYQRRVTHHAKCMARNRQIREGHLDDDTRDRLHLVNCNEYALHPNTAMTLCELPANCQWFPVLAIGAGALTIVTMPVSADLVGAS